MVYPTVPGEYVPLLFVPGLNGVVYPEVYSTVTTRLASYGYLLASVDLYWPVMRDTHESREDVGRNAELAFKVLQWVSCYPPLFFYTILDSKTKSWSFQYTYHQGLAYYRPLIPRTKIFLYCALTVIRSVLWHLSWWFTWRATICPLLAPPMWLWTGGGWVSSATL